MLCSRPPPHRATRLPPACRPPAARLPPARLPPACHPIEPPAAPRKSQKKIKKVKKVIDLLREKAYLVSIERVIGTHYILGLQEREVKGRKKSLTV